MAEPASSPQPAQQPRGDKPDGKSPIENFGQWLSAIVATAALLYGIGILVLALQIVATYTQNFSMAWYLASLTSEKTILGWL